MRRCDYANDNKKHARGVSLSRLKIRGSNPGTRFCWRSENIAPDSDERQESGYQNPKAITLNQRVSEWLGLLEKCQFLVVFL